MSERTDSQIIHEARGLCWHKFEHVNSCSECGKHVYDIDYENKERKGVEDPNADFSWPKTPDYTDPTSWSEVAEELQESGVWGEWLDWLEAHDIWADKVACDIDLTTFVMHGKLGSHALAEFLEGREG